MDILREAFICIAAQRTNNAGRKQRRKEHKTNESGSDTKLSDFETLQKEVNKLSDEERSGEVNEDEAKMQQPNHLNQMWRRMEEEDESDIGKSYNLAMMHSLGRNATREQSLQKGYSVLTQSVLSESNQFTPTRTMSFAESKTFPDAKKE